MSLQPNILSDNYKNKHAVNPSRTVALLVHFTEGAVHNWMP